jgi:hypothetical protein
MQPHTNNGSRSELSAQVASQMGRARRLGIEFLYTELEFAEAFLDLAETTSDATSARRNLLNTAKALDAIGKFTQQLNPPPPHRELLSRRASQLRKRLSEVDLRRHSHNGSERGSHLEGYAVTSVRGEHQPDGKPLREVNSHDPGSPSS